MSYELKFYQIRITIVVRTHKVQLPWLAGCLAGWLVACSYPGWVAAILADSDEY